MLIKKEQKDADWWRVGASLDLMHKARKKDQFWITTLQQFGQEGFGFEDIKELSKRGYGKSQIQNYVKDLEGQGVNIGERVGACHWIIWILRRQQNTVLVPESNRRWTTWIRLK